MVIIRRENPTFFLKISGSQYNQNGMQCSYLSLRIEMTAFIQLCPTATLIFFFTPDIYNFPMTF